MFSYHSIEQELQQENSIVQHDNSVLQGQKVERRRISTVGNFYNFANSVTTTEITTPITTANPSIHSRCAKSVVASVSMSVERKDSIEYIVKPCSKLKSESPRVPHPSCIIPPGQSTVIHFDNYTKFMSQRVTTTTRSDVNSSAAISNALPITNKQLGEEDKNDYHSAQRSSTGISGSSTLDIDLQVIFGGSSKNLINKKTLTMHKQKMMASKSINNPSKIRNRKESLALDSYIMPPPTPSDKKIKKPQIGKTDSSNKPKSSLLKKPKRTAQKKVKEPTADQKQKQALAAEESLVPQMSRFTQTDKLPKILKPCVNLLHDKKCPHQLKCPYLHSDFPCKYYYYNLQCPDGTACKFMHNGPLSAQLKTALQHHLVDLLSGGGKLPTETEFMFVQQMQNIEDLSVKLKKIHNKATTSPEVIELMDDEDEVDGDQVLVIDESIGEIKIKDYVKPNIPSLNPLQNTQLVESLQPNTPLSLNPLQNTQQTLQKKSTQARPQQVLALVPTRIPRYHKLDTEFKIFKKVNTMLGNIEDNLENLKKSNKTAEEKNKELIDIYEQLMNQDKLLTKKVITIEGDDIEPLTDHDTQPHIILLDPEIVHDIQHSPESLIILTDDEATNDLVLSPKSNNDIDISQSDASPEKLTQSELCDKDDDHTLSLVNVNSFENQSELLEKENRETIKNISTAIQEMMDDNNMKIWKISTMNDKNPGNSNVTETISKSLTLMEEQEMRDNNSNKEESQQDSPQDNKVLTTKIPNLPEEKEQHTTALMKTSPSKPNDFDSFANNSLNLNLDSEKASEIANSSSAAHEDETESLESLEMTKCQPIMEFSTTNLHNEGPQTTNPNNNSILLSEETVELNNSLQKQQLIDNTDHIKNISPAKISNPPEQDNNEITSDTASTTEMLNNKPSYSLVNKEPLPEVSNSLDGLSLEKSISLTTPSTQQHSKDEKELQQQTSSQSHSSRQDDMTDHNKDSDSPPYDETSTLELAISCDEKDIIEGHEDDESPPYEKITSTSKSAPKVIPKTYPRTLPRSRIRLRSHTVQNNEEADFKSSSQESEISTTIEGQVKAFKKFRRLRLPKPASSKTIEKSSGNEREIAGEIINRLVEEGHENPTPLQDLEAPLTQNVIITNRFLKKAKAAKLCQQELDQRENLNDTLENIAETTCDNIKNVELNMFALHNNDNFELTICTQTSSDGSQSLNLSQDPLMVVNDQHHNESGNDAIATFLKCHDEVETKYATSSLTSPKKIKNPIQLKRRISFEKASSPPRVAAAAPAGIAPAPAPSPSPTPTPTKQQFVLGNPHVVLTKLKPPLLLQISTQKQMQADSTTSNANNSIVVSSSTNSPKSTAATTSATLLSGDTSSQSSHLGRKRRSFTPESDLDSSLKADKLLKEATRKCARKVNFRRQQRSSSDKDDFNTDSSDEKPTKADALQSSSSSSSSLSTDNERAFKPATSTGHHVTIQQQHHQNVHLDGQQQQQLQEHEQHENESDLRQQIENVSNKSDLQLQLQSQSQQQPKQKHQLQMQKEIETTTTTTSIKNNNDLPYIQQEQIEKNRIANTCNPFDGNTQISAAVDKDKAQQQQPPSPTLPPKHIEVNVAKPTSVLSNKYPNDAPISPGIFEENIKDDENTDLFKYSSLYNKLSLHAARRQINFENSSVNITPIASPTYVGGDNTIASPSPVRGDPTAFDIRLGGEIDGRMTYPPMRYILRRIDVGKGEINKPPCIDKLAKTTYLDPRIFRSHVKPIPHSSHPAVPIKYSTTNSALSASSSTAHQATTMLPYDPRNRSTAMMSTTPPTPPSNNQIALACCNMNSTTELLHMGELQTPAVGVPLQQQHHHQHHHQQQHHQVHHQIPAQQTPNMLLYGCLQRSPWYQSLMSTMKIQINQSISQLVRALNNFQRERLLNPNIVFDIFKIDIAAELLEIMRNLGIFVDANGIINEQRHVPTYVPGRSCSGVSSAQAATIPVNATYSFIQQVLTPTTLGPSMMTTASSSTYNAATAGALNVNEPFVSCYIEAPKVVQLKPHHQEVLVSSHSPQDDNNHQNNNGDSYSSHHQRRSNNEFKKPYDNNNQQNGQQRGSYSQNPRFNRSYQNSESNSPTRTSPHPLSPRGGAGGGGGRGGGGGGRGGRYNNNNNRRFNNSNYGSSSSARSSSSPPPPGNSFNNRNNRSYNSNNSPTKTSSPPPPPQSYGQYRNSSLKRNNSSSPPPPPPPSSSSSSSFQQKSPPPALSAKPATSDEEDWD